MENSNATTCLPGVGRPEAQAVARCLTLMDSALDWRAVQNVARPWVEAVRRQPAPFWALESLLAEYPISSAEGLALMRLAEALLRVPDADTAIALTADQLGQLDAGGGDMADAPPQRAAGSALGRLTSAALSLSRQFLPEGGADGGLLGRLGARTVVAAALRAVQLLGGQFVLGEDMPQALRRAARARGADGRIAYSFDMLGEGARTEADARRHAQAYADAIGALAMQAASAPPAVQDDGISIKLSALHPRYEDAQQQRVMDELVPRVWSLCEQAARADLPLTIDAEESERLELSLHVLEALAERIAKSFPGWSGFGLAIQAYQTRALDVVAHVIALARRLGLTMSCRLVKGAYWDAEIKRAQELGLPHYPVFTHKHHTDASYLACARMMLDAPDAIRPQFATHNAGTIAAIVQMARRAGAPFELQRLHGMGEGIYREVLRDPLVRLRVYAPVGRQRDLLAYLVRRLLENGANSSFVHQLADESVVTDALLASPLWLQPASGVTMPADLFGAERRNSVGVDLADAAMRAPLLAAWQGLTIDPVPDAGADDVPPAVRRAMQACPAWAARSVAERAAVLDAAAQAMQADLPLWCARLVAEARKTWPDAVAEVREAIDFLRYYAAQAQRVMAPQPLPGPTGETNTWQLRGRGVWVAISPWNFPLAIFIGQVAAALVTGNAVLAKPAEQTPAIAAAAVAALHAAGVPREVLQLLSGPGETVGAALVAHPQVAGVVFTGSTAVARLIQRSLADRPGPIAPLIAETGGLNAMLVDSSALPEQVCDAVIQSAFRSAGQRCSALRLLCVHEAVADDVIAMIRGAMAELRTGEPSRLDTDVGPVIDAAAAQGILGHIARLADACGTPADAPAPEEAASQCVRPRLFELAAIEDLREEIFGPVLHVVRWGGDPLAVVERINALGYGLTFGIHTRIDSRAQALAAASRAGNVYVNRNIVGAVVGVQPFGGEGLSGTGPKAGGPLYLPRFCAEQVVTVNTAAAGGNVTLMTQGAAAVPTMPA